MQHRSTLQVESVFDTDTMLTHMVTFNYTIFSNYFWRRRIIVVSVSMSMLHRTHLLQVFMCTFSKYCNQYLFKLYSIFILVQSCKGRETLVSALQEKNFFLLFFIFYQKSCDVNHFLIDFRDQQGSCFDRKGPSSIGTVFSSNQSQQPSICLRCPWSCSRGLIIQCSNLSAYLYTCAVVHLSWLHDVVLVISVLFSNADREVCLGRC